MWGFERVEDAKLQSSGLALGILSTDNDGAIFGGTNETLREAGLPPAEKQDCMQHNKGNHRNKALRTGGFLKTWHSSRLKHYSGFRIWEEVQPLAQPQPPTQGQPQPPTQGQPQAQPLEAQPQPPAHDGESTDEAGKAEMTKAKKKMTSRRDRVCTFTFLHVVKEEIRIRINGWGIVHVHIF
uniref:Uncharacterized protein n=1 Tax=Branchiostoma floridae TaxID=7739 RepID=C3Y869_BRAFL|eukprot:XP_002607528.1 hypothetical protein BRAFLDRAFT_106476 [Branchiostoma floridae]